MGAGGGSTA
uniref:Uncharacterized protein n=1 Tax=Arundo donax TaxID=35708 RepID=A0A0A8Z2A0_ARUDO